MKLTEDEEDESSIDNIIGLFMYVIEVKVVHVNPCI